MRSVRESRYDPAGRGSHPESVTPRERPGGRGLPETEADHQTLWGQLLDTETGHQQEETTGWSGVRCVVC